MNRRAEAIIRAFIAKNDLTMAQFHNFVSHILVANQSDLYDMKGRITTLREKFGLPAELTPHNPAFEELDLIMRRFMETNTPEEYQKLPYIKRMFGNIFKPLTRRDIEVVERELAEEDKQREAELPPADLDE